MRGWISLLPAPQKSQASYLPVNPLPRLLEIVAHNEDKLSLSFQFHSLEAWSFGEFTERRVTDLIGSYRWNSAILRLFPLMSTAKLAPLALP